MASQRTCRIYGKDGKVIATLLPIGPAKDGKMVYRGDVTRTGVPTEAAIVLDGKELRRGALNLGDREIVEAQIFELKLKA